MSKYRRGGHILSLDELAKQKLVYFQHKIYHEGWFGSWQLRFIKRNIGENGHIYYAEKIAPDTIECSRCGRRFTDKSELKRFVEVHDGVDDVYVVGYDKGIAGAANTVVFRGCPDCRTERFLIDLEVKK